MFIDYLLIGVFKLGVEGAAIASLSGMLFGSVGPFLYFRFSKQNLIKIGKTAFNLRDILQSILNGSSEFVSNISGSIVTMVFNIQLLKYIGEDGVSAYGVIGYVCFVFFAIFIGYSVGVAPLIGYNYGANNGEELSNILKKSFNIVEIVGIVMTVLGVTLARPIAYIFTSSSESLLNLSTRAMRLFSICYLFTGFSMFGSSIFTALNNGIVSAVISICRTLVFQMAAVFILPLIMGVDGIWVSIIVAEFLSMLMTIIIIFKYQKKYNYKIISFYKNK
jgi:Na+-driven multidrug efflux pump